MTNISLDVWKDGDFISLQEANINVLTHSFHYGVGVYEGVRCYDTKEGPIIFRLEDHTERLMQSAHILGMQILFSQQSLNEAQISLIVRNKHKDAYIRPLVYYDGDGYIGLHTKNLQTKIFIVAFEWKHFLTEKQQHDGIRVKTSTLSRYHPNSLLTKAKSTGKYLSTVLALQEANESGVDDAIFLDQQGFVSEGSGANIFMVRNNILYTPETTSALDGMTRDTVFTLAKDGGYQVIEKRFTRDELYIADEVFFTGTASEIIGISEVDSRKIGSGKTGPITQWLSQQYNACVRGLLPEYEHWLTRIKQPQSERRHTDGSSNGKEVTES